MAPSPRAFGIPFAVLLSLGIAAAAALGAHQSGAPAQAELPAGHPAVANAAPEAAPNPPAAQPGALPAGHPAVTPKPSAGDVIPPVAAGAGSGVNAVSWTAPASWLAQPPANAMRRAQYQVPGPGGDGECVVFYFGPGQGGDPMGNAQRWASQFVDATGQSAVATMKTRTEQVHGVTVLFVEASGTFGAGSMTGMGQGVAKPDWAPLGGVAEGADANWFFKFTGPKATVEAQPAAFEEMLRSVRRGG